MSYSRGGVLWTQKLRTPLVGAQAYQSFLLYKVGQNIALHAAPADRASNYVVYAFQICSTSFFPQTSVILNSEMCPK